MTFGFGEKRCRKNLPLVDIDRLLKLIYKPETVALIESVKSGSVHLIGQPNGSVKSISLTEPRDLTPEQLVLLRDLLLDADSYFFARKRCIPKPTARFRLNGDDGYVTITAGFACSGWIIQSPHDRTGSFFDPVRDSVLGLVKQLFPEYASPNRRSVWRAGAMKSLIDAASESST